ncbi:uncharacterized protein KGF55_003104 [Candida pseudojiufengensis]|uniref:uncharacterized protein n=1 Tax=Candida pseudojiufengensis TaxID=497109 RepID=UPI002224C475|nr:uncharacterized protein KGF55_003104 [Candida pseudojiufengensis]KAI5963312.1 hypothetical protein KGF55_003104 [Candida pseudojiufengensis]
MIINSLIIVLGLEALLKQILDDPNQMDIHSPFDKVVFLIMSYIFNNSMIRIKNYNGFFIRKLESQVTKLTESGLEKYSAPPSV